MIAINSRNLKFAGDIRLLERNETVILYSIMNSAWVKISKEAFHIIKKQDIYDSRYDSIIQSLKKYRIIHDSSDDNLTYHNEQRLKSLYIFLTRKCNMACEFCSMNSGPAIDTRKEASLEDTLQFLKKLNHISISRIIISGGEPLLSDKLDDVIDYIHENSKSKIILQTNGMLINKTFCQSTAQKVNKVNISIESICDNQQGYEKILLDKIALLHNYGINMEFSYVVTTKNMQGIYRFIDLCVEYNAEISIKLVSSVKDDIKYKDLLLDEEQVLKFYYSLFKYIIKQGYDKCSNINGIIEYNPIPREGCSAYEGNILALMPEGLCYPCHSVVGAEYKIFNIKETSSDSSDITFEKNKMSIFSIDSKIFCRQCHLKYFCGGTCTSEIYENMDMSDHKPASCEYKKIVIEYYLWKYSKGESLRKQIDYIMNKIEEVIIKKNY